MDSHFPIILLGEGFYGKCLRYWISAHRSPGAQFPSVSSPSIDRVRSKDESVMNQSILQTQRAVLSL